MSPRRERSPALIYEGTSHSIYYEPDGEFGRPVAVKVLHADTPGTHDLIHFSNELEMTKDLVIAGVRRAIAQVTREQKLALVLEYISGTTLRQAFSEEKPSIAEFLQIAVQLAHILGELHQHGVFHRNITGHHILVTPETKELTLIGFSLASRIDLQVQHMGNPEGLEGTLGYISPEQTGRMNRLVDYRTDMYSLGVTLYELLTGQLPFDGEDPLAIVHAHIAREPVPATSLRTDTPPVVSEILTRLLAKNAEDRYQSAFGLQADLERCLTYLQTPAGRQDPGGLHFSLGQDDYSGRLHIPGKLYGRSAEITRLLAAFDRVGKGGRELVLVSGPAGVGKSALVAEVHKPITARRGYFIGGKFNQYQQNTPYSAFVQAFNEFAELLLTEREATLEVWKGRILEALGGNGAVLTEVVSNLEKVLGPQPPVPALDGQESRNRFNLTVENFVQAISAGERPLVLFIDDWQWADLASVELLKVLLMGVRIRHLLLIGAYRANELSPEHPFQGAIRDLDAARIPVQKIEVGNLEPDNVRQLVQDSLGCPAGEAQTVAELISAKTGGNAFFARQFLQNLYEEDWLRFDFSARRWTWNLAQIKAQNIADNIIELMAGKLRKLRPETAHLLFLAACLGNEFELHTLAIIGRTTEPEALAGLEEALIQGLVIPRSGDYRLPDAVPWARFRFLHDRVQQAAYTQVSAQEQQALHLEIGRLLLADTLPQEQSQKIFSVVQHYNEAVSLIADENERCRLAELNMNAADLARSAGAFRSAQSYLEVALSLLPADAWDKRYAAMLRVHSQLATVLSLTGEFERLDAIFQITEGRARTVIDSAQVRKAKIQGLLARGFNAEAIDLGLGLIEALGVTIDRTPSLDTALAYLQETADWLTPARIDALSRLPESSPETDVMLEIAVLINGPVYNTNMPLCFVFVSRMTRLCVERGLTFWSPVTLETFALLLCAGLNDIPKARRLTDVTMQLYRERYPSETIVPFLSVAIGGFITHRYSHLKNTLAVLGDGAQKGLATGMFQFAGYCTWWHAWHHLLCGSPLTSAESVSLRAIETCRKIHMDSFRNWSLLNYQVTLNLQGKSQDVLCLKGDLYNEEEMLPLLKEAKDHVELARLSFYKGWLSYLFGKSQAAVEMLRESESYLPYEVGMYLVPLFYFYDSLANAALADVRDADACARTIARLDRNLQQLETWVQYAPMNHQHKKDLIEAEKLRLQGRNWEAAISYDKAVRGAAANSHVPEEAVACERAAEFYLDRGMEEIAKFFMSSALNGYGRWEARAKVRDLERRYPRWFAAQKPLRSEERSIGQNGAPRSLDLMSVTRASQAIYSQIVLEDLLKQLMAIVIQNAGAQRGCLIRQKDQQLFIAAEGTSDPDEAKLPRTVEIESSDAASPAVVRYVARTFDRIALEDASRQGLFVDDPYMGRHMIKSVLCLPLLNRGRLSGILYLENNLATGAFTPERIEVLEVLAGQAAVALENAELYQRAQEEIAERRFAEAALRGSEERLRTLIETTSDWVWETDQNGVYTYASPKVRQLLGYEQEDVIGKTPFDLMPPEEASRIEDKFREIVASRRPFDRLENVGLAKDGRLVVLETSGVPFFDKAGNLLGYRGIDRDITDRKHAQERLRILNEELERRVLERTTQLEMANKELEAFAYSISHDLRAPLRAIGGYASILTEDYGGVLDEEGKHVCSVIVQETRRMGHLIDDLLALSRLDRQGMQYSPIDMKRLAESVFYEITSVPERGRIRFDVTDLPPAPGDQPLMRQVWENLLSNAVKFSSKREESRITVDGRAEAHETIYWVRDNGAGFDMSYVEKIFGVFQRLHSNLEFEGSGVGLAIVQRIVRWHGGRVWAEGEPEKGATFYFSLPREGSRA